MAKERGKRVSIAVSKETASALSALVARAGAPSTAELLRVAVLEPRSILRSYVHGVRAEADARVVEFDRWDARQGSGSTAAGAGPRPTSGSGAGQAESGPRPAAESGPPPAPAGSTSSAAAPGGNPRGLDGKG